MRYSKTLPKVQQSIGNKIVRSAPPQKASPEVATGITKFSEQATSIYAKMEERQDAIPVKISTAHTYDVTPELSVLDKVLICQIAEKVKPVVEYRLNGKFDECARILKEREMMGAEDADVNVGYYSKEGGDSSYTLLRPKKTHDHTHQIAVPRYQSDDDDDDEQSTLHKRAITIGINADCSKLFIEDFRSTLLIRAAPILFGCRFNIFVSSPRLKQFLLHNNLSEEFPSLLN